MLTAAQLLHPCPYRDQWGHRAQDTGMAPASLQPLPELPRQAWVGLQELRAAKLTLLALCHTGHGREQPCHPPAGLPKEGESAAPQNKMDQPSKGVGQGLKNLETSVLMPQRYRFAPKAVPPSRVHSFLHTTSQNTHRNTPANDCPLHCFSDGISQTAPQLQHFSPPCTEASPSLRFHC